jgi:hypothetical protein
MILLASVKNLTPEAESLFLNRLPSLSFVKFSPVSTPPWMRENPRKFTCFRHFPV